MPPVFEIREWYQLKRGDAFVGVDLVDELATLDELQGKMIILKTGERNKIVKVIEIHSPIPQHLPPYRRGERIGLRVEFEQGD